MARKQEKSESTLKLRIILTSLIIVIIFIILAGFVGFQISNKMNERRKPQIDNSYISERIRNISDLTTAEMIYTGLITYSDNGIPFLTQTHFSMIYSANIRAGVDASKITIDVSDEKVVIDIPDAEIQSIDVDPDSIKFYDEQFALFNQSEKQDVVDAISAAKEDVTSKADTASLIQHANEQTTYIIEGILSTSIGDRELVIQ